MREEQNTATLSVERPLVSRETELVEMVFDLATGPRSPLSPQERGVLLLRVRSEFSVEDVCRTLSLSTSEYYATMKSAENVLQILLAHAREREESIA